MAASEAEELLAGIWSAAFEREVGTDESFLDLGGDSLTAAEIAAAIEAVFGARLDLQVFVSDVTVASLAAELGRGPAPADDRELPPLRPIGRTGPLSSAQARMWNSPQHGRTDPFWNVVVPFRIRGELDLEALRTSLEELVARHEILRTAFVDCDGTPAAVVRPPAPFALSQHDLVGRPDAETRLDRLLEAELATRFDLEHGPLLRVAVIRMGEREHQLLRTTHHLVHDALSWRVFFRELAALYEARIAGRPSPLGDPPQLQYLDYAVWERAALRPDSPSYRAEVDWWQRRLQPPVANLQLPFPRPAASGATDGPPPPSRSPDGSASWGIAPATSAGLDRLGRAAGATFYMTRLAAYSALLCLDTGAEEIVIGTPMSTRSRAELQSMIGVFLNVALLRLRLQGEPSFRDWVAETRRTVIEASRHVTIPTERLMAELARRGLALPRVEARFVAWATMSSMSFGGLELEPLPRRCTAGMGFRLGVNRPFEADRCWAEYDADRFDPDAVAAFLTRLRAFSAAAAVEPDRSLRDLHASVTVSS
jgi:acyl carrier protein